MPIAAFFDEQGTDSVHTKRTIYLFGGIRIVWRAYGKAPSANRQFCCL